MSERSREKQIMAELAKHNCCNGHVYYDGRCGDGPIYIHEDNCRVGKREKAADDYWANDRR
jgi:hypothetical protein